MAKGRYQFVGNIELNNFEPQGIFAHKRLPFIHLTSLSSLPAGGQVRDYVSRSGFK